MLQNYLTLLIRQIQKHTLYAIISLMGLVIGFACSILCLMFIWTERHVNSHFNDINQIYRVESIWEPVNMGLQITTVAPIAPLLTLNSPLVENHFRYWSGVTNVSVGDKGFRKEFMLADSTLFQIFDFDFLYGDPLTALEAPNSVVITERLAKIFYGTSNVLNRILTFHLWTERGKSRDYKITGVLKDPQRNSITNISGGEPDEMILPMANLADFMGSDAFSSWNSKYIVSYLLLSKAASVEKVEQQALQLIQQHAPQNIRDHLTVKLAPLATVHLTQFNGQVEKRLRLFALVGVFIMFMAGINYVNLATARASIRFKEISIRKVIGATHTHLICQFLLESILMSLMAMGTGIILVGICHEMIAGLTGIETSVSMVFYQPGFWVMVIGLSLGIGLLAGIYPALYLASFDPITLLRKFYGNRFHVHIRKILVVVQFAIAIVLIIGTQVVSNQLTMMLSRDLGYEKDGVLVIHSVPRNFTMAGQASLRTAKQKLRRLAGVEAVSSSWGLPELPAANDGASLQLSRLDWPETEYITMSSFNVDDQFHMVFGLRLKNGQFLNKTWVDDPQGDIVINEAAVAALGLEDPIGQQVRFGQQVRTISGVVNNFHFQTLHTTIKPMVFFSGPIYRYISLRLATSDVNTTIQSIQSVWQEVYPAMPMTYDFFDERLANLYEAEQRMHLTFRWATGLAFFIACLGLYGLASFTVAQRTKEIGIRKVLGASITKIVILLIRTFTLQVFIGIMIAWPVAYYILTDWLQNFAFHIEMGIWPFVTASLLAIVLALVTVSIQAIVLAQSNPVDTLRYD